MSYSSKKGGDYDVGGFVREAFDLLPEDTCSAAIRSDENKRLQTDLGDLGVAASSAEHQRRVAVAVTHVEAAVRVEQEANDACTVVPDGHVKRRPIALATRVDVAAVTNQSTYYFCTTEQLTNYHRRTIYTVSEKTGPLLHFFRAMLCKRAALAVTLVRVSVTFVNSVITNKHIFKNFHSRFFPHQTLWQYSDAPLFPP